MQDENKPFYRLTLREWFELIKVMVLHGVFFAILGSGFWVYSKIVGDEIGIINFVVVGFCVGLVISFWTLSEQHSKLWILGFPLGFLSWMICSYITGIDFTLGENLAAAIGCGFTVMLIHFLPYDEYN